MYPVHPQNDPALPGADRQVQNACDADLHRRRPNPSILEGPRRKSTGDRRQGRDQREILEQTLRAISDQEKDRLPQKKSIGRSTSSPSVTTADVTSNSGLDLR